jgi:hypothetical protein
MNIRVWGLLLVVALAAPAAAQEASFDVAQSEAPSELTLEAGESTSMSPTVALSGEGFSCSQEVEAPVNTTVATAIEQPSPENANVTASDVAKTFPIRAGEYTTTPYNETANATIDVETDSGVTENYTATLEVTSTFPGGTYEACVPNEFPEASSDPVQIQLEVTADEEPEDEEPEEPTEPMNDTVGNESTNDSAADDGSDPAGEDSEDGIPAPGAVVPLALVGAALLATGRRRG